MSSKLPVSVRRRPSREEKRCRRAPYLNGLINNSDPESGDKVLEEKASSSDEVTDTCIIEFWSRSTQTLVQDTTSESEKVPYSEIKILLLSINSTLEQILKALHTKKEFLYNKLQEEVMIPCIRSKSNTRSNISKSKHGTPKNKSPQFTKKNPHVWPEISRLYYGQPPWMKHYMQKIAYDQLPSSNSFLVCPRTPSWLFTPCPTRPFSCPNINYFQPMGNLIDRKMFTSPLPAKSFTSVEQGDSGDNDPDDEEEIKRLEKTAINEHGENFEVV